MSFLMSVLDWLRDPSHWTGDDGIPMRTLQHAQISFESVAIGAVIALPIGIALGHYGKFGNLAINMSNAARAVPSFGILIIAFQAFGLCSGGVFGFHCFRKHLPCCLFGNNNRPRISGWNMENAVRTDSLERKGLDANRAEGH